MLWSRRPTPACSSSSACRRLDHVTGDVRDAATLASAVAAFAPEIVFHLAAQPLVRLSYADPHGTFESNVMGVVNLFEAVRACPSVRAVVNVTSDKCYENDESAGDRLRRDRGARRPRPVQREQGVFRARHGRLSAQLLRPRLAGVRGQRAGRQRDRRGRLGERSPCPDCVRALRRGDDVVVRHPDAVRPWQHVLESLAGYLWLGARFLGDGHARDGAWNFGPAGAASLPVADVVAAFLTSWGGGSWRAVGDREPAPHEAMLLLLDSAKARDELGLSGVWDVRIAIARTAAWYRAWADGAADPRALVAADITRYEGAARALGVPWASALATAPADAS